MRYMDLEGHTHIRGMDICRYRHDYEGFYEKNLIQMSINRGRMTTIQGTHASHVLIFSFLLFLSR